MLKKAVLSLLIMLAAQSGAFASELSESINQILSSFDFERDSVVSISIKDKKTNSDIYSKQVHKALNPASTLKVYTMAAVLNALGEEYNLTASFSKDSKNNLYLTLSGDPLFKQENLEELCAKLKAAYKGKINKIYIDDTIIDLEAYPQGWMDDDIWPFETKISPYMTDRNIVKIDVFADKQNETIKVVQKNQYKIAYINKLKIGSKTNINIVKDDTYNAVILEGEIADDTVNLQIPVLNPKAYFCHKLREAMQKNGIEYSDKFYFAKTPKNANIIAKFERPIFYVIKHILSESDNIAAEMLFKIAASKYAKQNGLTKYSPSNNSFGTTKNGIEMFYNYYENLGLKKGSASIVDASGVSRYNALDVDWMTNALSLISEKIVKYLPTAGEGTLAKRMRELKGEGHFKTGTLKGTSALVGIIDTGDNEYYYASIILSMKRNNSLLKGVEDEVVYEIYRMNKNEGN